MPSLEDLTPDQLLAEARRMSESDALLRTLMGSPDTRESTLRLVKKVKPTQTIPEIDVKDAVAAETERLRKENDKRWEELQSTQITAKIEAERKRVKDAYGLSDADLAEVEKLMVDPDITKRVPTYDGAARVFKAERQAATPTPGSLRPPVFTMPDTKVWGKGIGNPRALDRVMKEETYAALNEFRKQS